MRTFVAGIIRTLLLGGVASAVPLTVTCAAVPLAGMQPTELNGSIVCPQFSLPDVLTSMSLTLSGAINGTITIVNTTAQPQTGSAQTQVQFNFGPLAGFTLASPLLSVVGSTGSQTFQPGVPVVTPVGGSQSSGPLVNSVNLAPYIGNGTFSIPVSTATFLLSNITGGGSQVTQATNASAEATLTYTYEQITSVPEPTTLALLGTGLLLAVARKRRER